VEGFSFEVGDRGFQPGTVRAAGGRGEGQHAFAESVAHLGGAQRPAVGVEVAGGLVHELQPAAQDTGLVGRIGQVAEEGEQDEEGVAVGDLDLRRLAEAAEQFDMAFGREGEHLPRCGSAAGFLLPVRVPSLPQPVKRGIEK
jgi:hypothetical protein